jgi:hypothetical protein
MNWGNHLDHPSASATKRAGAASRRAGRGGRRRYQPGWMPVSAASGRRTMASGSPVRAARPIEPQTSKSAKPDQASKTIQQSRRAPATTASGQPSARECSLGLAGGELRFAEPPARPGRAGLLPVAPARCNGLYRRTNRGSIGDFSAVPRNLCTATNARLIRPVRQSLAPSLGETVIARDVAVAKFGPPLERQFTSAETVACSIYKNAAVGYSMHASIGSFPLVFRKEQ